MKKEHPLYQLIVMTAFIGILLTGAIFFVTNAAFEQKTTVAQSCYDGSVIEGNTPEDYFSRAVYQNATSQKMIREYQYRLFGVIDGRDVLVGKNDFLFETLNEETGYNYLEDYFGRLAFTAEESAQILESLKSRKQSYAQRGTEYLLVILPNSQTVYSENMPAYLGDISTTRLDRLESYLLSGGFSDFVNLTDELVSCKEYGTLYNNTENSLNSLGFYYSYLCVCRRFSSIVMSDSLLIARGDLSFYQYLTTGKTAARKAGIEDVAKNLTVSLSNSTKLKYHVQQTGGRTTKTIMKAPFDSPDIYKTPSLLLQFSSPWERAQLEPFFSNTFLHVTYQTDLADDAEIFAEASPDVVVQFIHESELSLLLE